MRGAAAAFVAAAALVSGCGSFAAIPSAPSIGAGQSGSVGWPASPAPSERLATRDPDSPYRTTRDQFLLATKACLEDRGFSVDLDMAQGGFKFSLGDDSRAADAKSALKGCVAQVDPRRAEPPPRLSRDQLIAWYAYKRRIADCLAGAGVAIPDPPPEAVFIDTNGAWDPFGSVLDAGGVVAPGLQTRCQHVEGAPAFLGW